MRIIRNTSPGVLAATGLFAAILSITAAYFSRSFLENTGLPIPDMVLHLFLTRPESAFSLYGDLAATDYWRVQATDILLPAAYGAFLAMLYGRFTADRGATTLLSRSWILPVMAAFSDYAENGLIAIHIYLVPSARIAAAASIASLLKWMLLAFSITVLSLLIIRSIYVTVNNPGRQRLDGGGNRARNTFRKKKNN